MKNFIMDTHAITVKLPADILLTLNETETELEQQLRISFALRLYGQQKITIGKAAQLAGLSRWQFEILLAENKSPVSNLTFEDIVGDVKKLEE
jgi:predicted HTH domain antitoxin